MGSAKKFYAAFANRDAEVMAGLYDDSIEFSDPAFGKLHGERARDMWRMLLKLGSPEITSQNFEVEGSTVRLKWEAKYPFGPNKRPVHNKVSATMRFNSSGKIIEHSDDFDMKAWMAMAMGGFGKIFGGIGLVQGVIRGGANKQLDRFIARRDKAAS